MASRRQTLGALSPGQLNSRASMAGAGRVADKGADSKRMTMLGGPARAEKGAVASERAMGVQMHRSRRGGSPGAPAVPPCTRINHSTC